MPITPPEGCVGCLIPVVLAWNALQRLGRQLPGSKDTTPIPPAPRTRRSTGTQK